jgi:hypothetical protein
LATTTMLQWRSFTMGEGVFLIKTFSTVTHG